MRSPHAPASSSPPGVPPTVTVPLKVITCALVILGLYLGQAILVPLALAALLSFLLAPAVDALRRRHLPQSLAVAVVLGLALSLLTGAALMVSSQVLQLSRDLPRYQDQVHGKLTDLRRQWGSNSSMGAAARMMGVVEREVDATRQALVPATTPARAAPQPVRVVTEAKPPWQAVSDLVGPFIEPLLSTGIAIVLVFFILLDRQDLRDRLIRLAGSDLHTMSAALDEAAHRVSRYLGMQVLVNLAHGLAMAVGLSVIGIPGALAWGALAAVLRFVPYLGPVVAAAFPLAIAFAVDPGWTMLGWALAWVLLLELVSNNVVEPVVYGTSTGLGTVALLVSAAFWTALWGPVGLVLATPITVCLVVLGRHLPSLHFLELLLGSAPVFDRPTRLYNLMLSGHELDALTQATAEVRRQGLPRYYDEAVMPTLLMGQGLVTDQTHARHRQRLSGGLRHLVRDLGDLHGATRYASPAAHRIACFGLRREADDLGAEMLSQCLNLERLPTRLLPLTAPGGSRLTRADALSAEVLCLSSVQRPSPELIRQACRRLKQERPGVRILLVLWALGDAELGPQGRFGSAQWPGLGVDGIVNAIGAAVQQLRAMVQLAPAGLSNPGPATPTAWVPNPARSAGGPVMDGTAAARHAAEVFRVRQGLVAWTDGRVDSWPMMASEATRSWLPQVLSLSGDEAWVLPDLARDARLDLALGANLGWHSLAGAPVRDRQGRIHGQLVLIHDEPRTYDEADQRVLAAQGRHLAAHVALLGHLDAARPDPMGWGLHGAPG